MVTRQAGIQEITTIADPDGGAIDRGGANGRNGNHSVRPVDTTPTRPEQGTLVVEGNTPRVEGNREILESDAYFLQQTLPTLRHFVAELVGTNYDHLTRAQEIRYNGVIADLANKIRAEAVAPINQGCESYLLDVGGQELATRIERSFDAQFAQGFLLIDTYAEEVTPGVPSAQRLNQEKALLVYTELMLNRMNGQVEINADELGTTLQELGFTQPEAYALGRAFTGIYGHVEPTLFSFVDEVTTDSNFIPLDEEAEMVSVLSLLDDEEQEEVQRHLNPTAVIQHLEHKNAVVEGAYRVLIGALDGLNEPAHQAWIEQREQNPEINLNEQPFSTWEAQIAEKNGITLQAGEHLPSKYYINGCLGTEKSESKLFGIQGTHKLKHVIKNADHKAPVRSGGQGKEKLEKVQAAEITLMAGVYQGEWQQGKTLQPGESRPKEFFEKVVDVTIWSTSLNSADAVENFIDQLKEADALVLKGAEVTQVLGRYEDGMLNGAQAFRVPVMNHRGEPSFIVVDRETILEMMRVAQVSQESYARLAQRDPRYAVHSREERWKAFRPQMRQHENSPASWVDQERDFILTEEISAERIRALRAGGGEVDGFVADQLTLALENYRAQFNEFQMNYCRISRYRDLAVGRLARRNLTDGAPDYQNLLRGEMNAVALEYMNRWNAFRNITTRLVQEGAGGIDGATRELLEFLANIDYELEIQVRVNSTDVDEASVRQILVPSRRRLSPNPVVRTILPSISPAEAVENILVGEAVVEDTLGRSLVPDESLSIPDSFYTLEPPTDSEYVPVVDEIIVSSIPEVVSIANVGEPRPAEPVLGFGSTTPQTLESRPADVAIPPPPTSSILMPEFDANAVVMPSARRSGLENPPRIIGGGEVPPPVSV